MVLTNDDTRPVINRLKRAAGQLNGIIEMLEEGRDCEEIVVQIAAVSKALDRAGYSVVAAGMRECLIAENQVDTAKMEKLFLSLA